MSLALLVYQCGYAVGMVEWLSHVVVSSVIHALINGLVSKFMHQITLTQAAALVAVILVGMFLSARARDRR